MKSLQPLEQQKISVYQLLDPWMTEVQVEGGRQVGEALWRERRRTKVEGEKGKGEKEGGREGGSIRE